MIKMMAEKKKMISVIVIAAILVLAMGLVYLKMGPKAIAGSKTITVTVDHLNGDDSSFEIKTDKEYLSEAMEQENLISGSDSEYGLMVETVDGETADASKEQWWGFDVNGEFGQNGVDSQPIADGDLYEFKLNEGY